MVGKPISAPVRKGKGGERGKGGLGLRGLIQKGGKCGEWKRNARRKSKEVLLCWRGRHCEGCGCLHGNGVDRLEKTTNQVNMNVSTFYTFILPSHPVISNSLFPSISSMLITWQMYVRITVVK